MDRAPFQSVAPGDRLELSAAEWNALQETAARQLAGAAPSNSQRGPAAGAASMKNESGNDLARYAVVSFSEPIFTPASSLDAFKQPVSFRGIAPTTPTLDRIAITQEPIAPGQIGRAMLTGVTQVRLNVLNTAHRCARATAANTARLESADSGPATILWTEGGTGEQWALVRLATPCAAPPVPAVPCCTAAGLPAPTSVTLHWTWPTGSGATHTFNQAAARFASCGWQPASNFVAVADLPRIGLAGGATPPVITDCAAFITSNRPPTNGVGVRIHCPTAWPDRLTFEMQFQGPAASVILRYYFTENDYPTTGTPDIYGPVIYQEVKTRLPQPGPTEYVRVAIELADGTCIVDPTLADYALWASGIAATWP
jgi:hypothetical protein